jgi:CheY-like chemotaxis protein
MKPALKRLPSLVCYINALIVDDCSINRMVHRMLMDKYSNFKITEHSNGLEALEYVKILSGHNPEKIIILMDINMPVMNGIESTKAIRNLKLACPIIIIAISAFSDENDIKKIESCGISSYITKPVTKDKLQRILTLYC